MLVVLASRKRSVLGKSALSLRLLRSCLSRSVVGRARLSHFGMKASDEKDMMGVWMFNVW